MTHLNKIYVGNMKKKGMENIFGHVYFLGLVVKFQGKSLFLSH